MTGLDVLNRELRLPGEWQLGGGRRIVWAPTAPSYLDKPGFRDSGSYQGHPVEPVFAITLLDRDARPIHLQASERHWTPARLELKYRTPQALITEQRTVLPHDTFTCRWTMSHADEIVRYYWIVLWTCRSHGIGRHSVADIEANAQGISFQEAIHGQNGREQARWGCAMGASFDADSWSVNSAESAIGLPQATVWEETPFFDLMAPGGLPGHFPFGESASGRLYFALAYPFEIPPGERLVVNFSAAFAPEVEQARNNLERSVSLVNPIQASEEEWINWFEEVPAFSCSDPYLQRLYWYRWAQRKIWGSYSPSFYGDEHEDDDDMPTPSFSPDEDVLGRIIESSWHHSPEHVQAEMRSVLEQDSEALTRQALAHAARRVLSIHPDQELVEAIGARVRHLQKELGSKANELLTDKSVEPWCRDASTDEMVSLRRNLLAYDLDRLMAFVAEKTHGLGTSDQWNERARQLAAQIVQEFWNSEQEFFCDRIADGPSVRSAKTIQGFLPLLVGLADETQRRGLTEHLFDPEQFWTQYPLPSLTRDDADFNPDGRWENQRLDRPFNGRVWPALTSQVIDGLGRGVESASATERLLLATLIERTVKLCFTDGELDKPALYEHYNPLSGRPAAFLGRRHPGGGWLIDHLIRYVTGIRPTEQGQVMIDPLPFNVEWFAISRVFVGEHELEVQWDHRTGLTMQVDEAPAGHAPVGQSLSVTLPDHWVPQMREAI